MGAFAVREVEFDLKAFDEADLATILRGEAEGGRPPRGREEKAIIAGLADPVLDLVGMVLGNMATEHERFPRVTLRLNGEYTPDGVRVNLFLAAGLVEPIEARHAKGVDLDRST